MITSYWTTQLKVGLELVATWGTGHEHAADVLRKSQQLAAFRALLNCMVIHGWDRPVWIHLKYVRKSGRPFKSDPLFQSSKADPVNFSQPKISFPVHQSKAEIFYDGLYAIDTQLSTETITFYPLDFGRNGHTLIVVNQTRYPRQNPIQKVVKKWKTDHIAIRGSNWW